MKSERKTDPPRRLSAAREFNPDLILLDVMMPGLDGGTLSSYFLESPKFKDVPVVFLTATVTKEEVSSHGGLIGGLPFLAKPVDIAELVACLEAKPRRQIQGRKLCRRPSQSRGPGLGPEPARRGNLGEGE